MPRRHFALFNAVNVALYAVLLICWPSFGRAQDYPTKPVQVVVGFPPGSTVDMLVRPIAAQLSTDLGEKFVVENRPGATGIIANGLVAKAAPDGYTLLVAPSSSLTSVPYLHLHMPYSLKDFVPIAQMNAFPYVLLVNPTVPVKNVKELIALARARPGVLTFGSSGVGSGFHLAGVLFDHMAKVRMLHVPYKGGNLALTDLIAGRIDLMFYSLAVAEPQIKAGKVRAIAVTGRHRDPLMPELPTISASGLPGYNMTGWHGWFAPTGTPLAIVTKLNATIERILATPQIRHLWARYGMSVVLSTSERLAT